MSSASHGVPYTADNVAIEPGGKPVIGKFILTLMNPGDEVLYPNPGYPIYESQIEFHGGVAVPYGYLETDKGFAIDFDALEAAITPRTRLLVLNDLQNPLGAECAPAELERLAELVLAHDLWCSATRPTSTSATRAAAPRWPRCPAWPSAACCSTRSPRSSP